MDAANLLVCLMDAFSIFQLKLCIEHLSIQMMHGATSGQEKGSNHGGSRALCSDYESSRKL